MLKWGVLKGRVVMKTATLEKPVDMYLGFAIFCRDGQYVAEPTAWIGEPLIAEDLPTVRKKIWRWWHSV